MKNKAFGMSVSPSLLPVLERYKAACRAFREKAAALKYFDHKRLLRRSPGNYDPTVLARLRSDLAQLHAEVEKSGEEIEAHLASVGSKQTVRKDLW